MHIYIYRVMSVIIYYIYICRVPDIPDVFSCSNSPAESLQGFTTTTSCTSLLTLHIYEGVEHGGLESHEPKSRRAIDPRPLNHRGVLRALPGPCLVEG